MRKDTAETGYAPDRRGVAFLEFLAALLILALVVALVTPAYFRLRNRNRKLVVRTEVLQLEKAWDRYLAEYKQWPTNVDDGIFTITGRLARILGGEDMGGANTSKVVFMTFSNMDSRTNPISPWTSSNAYYYCRFDHDNDGIIRAGGVTNLYPEADMALRVIVWTTNIFAEPESTGTNTIVASWLN